MAADTTALLVARQVVAVDLRLDRIDGLDQLGGDVRRQELGQIEEGALADKFPAQMLGVGLLERRCGSDGALE